MKKTASFMFLAAAICVSGAAVPDPPNMPKRQPRIKQIGTKTVLTLTKENTVVVVAPENYETTRHAAQEMADLLGKILGGKLKVFRAPQKGKVNIYLGFNQWTKKAGIAPAKHHRDAFTLKITQEGIFIAGRDAEKINPQRNFKGGVWGNLYERSTLFGVYDFLERFAGARFYFPGELGTILPEKKALALPEVTIFDYPDFIVRKVSYYQGSWPGKPASYTRRNEKNLASQRYRLETSYIPSCHGLSRLGYLYRFAQSNPEYFALMDNGRRHNNPSLPHPGALCYSSGIREEIYQDVKSFLSGEPASKRGIRTRAGGRGWDPSGFQKGYADIMPQDSYYRCRCEKCAKVFGEGTNYATEFMWTFAAEIANRIKKDKIPGFVTMMAYRPYRDIPKVKLPDNLIVMVAERGPWGINNPKGQERDLKEIIAWTKKLNHKVWLWTYLCKFGKTGFPGVPSPTPHSLGVYLKQVTPYITGAYLESETDRFINNYLVYYIHGKYGWHNDINVDALIAEHHKLMFGKAAPVMAKLFEKFEKIWLKEIVGRQIDTDLGPAVVPPSDYDLWHKIYDAKRINEVKKAFDEAEKLVKGDKKSLARIKLFRSEWLDALTNARAAYFERTDAAKKFTCSRTRPACLRPFVRPSKEKATKAPVSTVVSIAEDKDNFIFTFDCEEPMLKEQIAVKRPHDGNDIWRDAGVELFLNPTGDRKNYYQIIINVEGSILDQKMVLQGNKSRGDKKWNSGAKAVFTKTSKGYKAVVTLPKKSLGNYDKKGFPVNFSRNRILSSGSGHFMLYTWSPFVRGFHDLENFGTMILEKEAPQNNLFSNGDFSAKPKGRFFGKWWAGHKLAPTQKWALDNTRFFTAPPSLRISNEKGSAFMHICQYLPQLKANTRYRLSGYIWYENVLPIKKGGGVVFNFCDSGNNWYPTNFLIGSSGKWVRQSFEFKTSPTTGTTVTGKKITPYTRLSIFNATGTVWFDDITLEELPAK